ncbi:MAG: metalloregulator ArsR/SmtB family transcription factor [Dehalococcoidia bacterium]
MVIPTDVDGRAIRESDHTRRIAGIFKALGDPTRIALLHLLSYGELNVGELARAIGSEDSISAVSHHLRVLRTARLVRNRREGKQIYYAIEDQFVVSQLNEVLTRVQGVGRS